MSRTMHSIWPLMRQDFNRAGEKYAERLEPSYELYFREAPPESDAKKGFFDKLRDKN